MTDLEALLAESRALGVEWSVSIRDDRHVLAEHRPTALLRTASVAKVFVLAELADRLVGGTVDAGLLLDRRSSLAVRDSGLWHVMRADRLPVTDVALLVGALSDNSATNALIDLCGLDSVRARAASWAPHGSTLHDYLRDERADGVPATVSEGCAEDWVAIMARLHSASDDVGRLVLGWLAHDADTSMVASAFDLDPLAHEEEDLGLRLWHKTGTDAGVRADVGVLAAGPRAVAYAVLANWPEADTSATTRRAVLLAMRGIGERIRADAAVR